MTAEKLIKSLISYYSLNNMSELSLKLKISQSVISNWRSRNSIGAIVEKINEIDENALYYIFENGNTTINQGDGARAAGRDYEENHSTDINFDNLTLALMQECIRKYESEEVFRFKLMELLQNAK